MSVLVGILKLKNKIKIRLEVSTLNEDVKVLD